MCFHTETVHVVDSDEFIEFYGQQTVALRIRGNQHRFRCIGIHTM